MATPLPVNNRDGRDCVCVCMQKTHQTERQKRESVHMAIKKTKVDEKETKEIKTKQKGERQALKSNETNVEHLQL